MVGEAKKNKFTNILMEFSPYKENGTPQLRVLPTLDHKTIRESQEKKEERYFVDLQKLSRRYRFSFYRDHAFGTDRAY